MRVKLISYYIFILFLPGFVLFIPGNASSQSSQFRNFRVKDGLPSSEVYNVIQDSKGYMWFCTDAGVCRFNGYEFKVFNTSNGLPENTIFEALEDHKGRIWFRSYSGRLSYYFHDSIFCLPINNTLSKLLKNRFAVSFAVDSFDNVYMGTGEDIGPIRINIKNNFSISHIPVDENVKYILLIPGNEIIMGTKGIPGSFPLSFYNIDSAGKVTGKSLPLNWPEIGSTEVHNKSLRLPGGLIATSLYSLFIVSDKNHNIIFSHVFSSGVLTMTLDENNRAWITTANDQPVCYSEGKIISYPVLAFLKDKKIGSVGFDKEGGTWFASLSDGVYYLRSFDFKTWTTENGLPANKVEQVTVAPDSTLWVTLSRNNKITLLKDDSISYRYILPIPDITINDVLFHKDKSIWVGTSNGIFIFKNAGSLDPLYTARNLRGGRGIALNDDGSIWYGGHSVAHLLKREGDSAVWEKTIDPGCPILKIYPEKEDAIWLATTTGLWYYGNGNLSCLGNSFPALKKPLNDITEAADGSLWITSTNDGLIIKKDKVLRYITAKDGLISNFCTCICRDYRGNMWVGTRKGISHVILGKDALGELGVKAIKNINSPNLEEINSIACVGNMIYVATNSGLTAFNMAQLSTDTIPPPVYITSVLANDKVMACNDTALNLRHNQNRITINYVGLTYTNAGNVEYRYKIVGLDSGWVYTKNTNVQYPDLSPGGYKFVVSAMNGDGVWNNQPATISFYISPPWWGTWWSRLTALVIIVGFIYWRIRVIQQREAKKTEINKQLATAELQKIKAQFDPHFLFNNLNTLSSFITSEPDNAQQFVDELSQFYRYTITHSKDELIDLVAEIEQAKRYLGLLTIRYGAQLIIEWHVLENADHYLILTNSLQILLENVVKHNNILSGEPLLVEIKTTMNKSLIVTNQVRAKNKAASTGIGLKSINERYKLLTGKEIIISNVFDYFSVELPLITVKEYESINY